MQEICKKFQKDSFIVGKFFFTNWKVKREMSKTPFVSVLIQGVEFSYL